MKTHGDTDDPVAAELSAGGRGSVLDVARLGTVEYDRALEIQRELVARRRAGEIADRLLLLEHPHVITLGSSASPDHIRADDAARQRLGVTVHEAGRGGDVTYHGPGQIVGYPILDLKPDLKDLHAYLRALEEVIIRALNLVGAPGGQRREGMTGVWFDQGKVAALGVRVSSGWITSHGFAVNVSTDLSYFETIVPCGIVDEQVTSVEQIVQHTVPAAVMEEALIDSFCVVFDRMPRPL